MEYIIVWPAEERGLLDTQIIMCRASNGVIQPNKGGTTIFKKTSPKLCFLQLAIPHSMLKNYYF